MATQIQMRGGSSAEHENFIGASREVTVDTTDNTLRVHDGITPGGNKLATLENLYALQDKIDDTFDRFESNISKSHNHDDKYSKLTHTHSQYVEKKNGTKGLVVKSMNDYNGLALEDGTDTNYIRTTKNGIIPYQSGGYSNIGTTSWRFANGYFNNVNTTKLIVGVDGINLKDGGCIEFANNDSLSYDDETNEYQLTSDGDINKSRLCLGHIELNGYRIYIGSSFPSGARTDDILIQI